MQTITATFVDGVLKPTQPLDLPAHAHVRLTVELVNENGKNQDVQPQTPKSKVVGIAVGTPEWNKLNERRATLIDKKYTPGQGLTDEEQAEFERLQQISSEAVERAFPRPRLAPDELAAVKQVLGIKDVGAEQ